MRHALNLDEGGIDFAEKNVVLIEMKKEPHNLVAKENLVHYNCVNLRKKVVLPRTLLELIWKVKCSFLKETNYFRLKYFEPK